MMAEGGIAVVQLTNPPVNVLNRGTLAALAAAFRATAGAADVNAVVLGSSSTKVFSAGLDIKEMVGASTESLSSYLQLVVDVFRTAYVHPKPVIAAMSGAAPAGGCWLGLLADYRIMTDAPNARIGLNETALGLAAPLFFSRPFAVAVGERAAERLLALGALVPPQEALRLGLVDALAPAADVPAAALAEARKWAAIPAAARTRTKLHLRSPLMTAVAADADAAAADFVASVLRPDTQALMAKFAR